MRLRRISVLWRDQGVQGDGEIEPSERRFRTWVLALAALIGPPLLFLFYYKVMFNGLFIPDALDYAQLGRNVGSGKGLATSVIRPLALEGTGPNVFRQPDLIHGPLYPIILALAFGIAGAKDSVVAWVSGLFYLLTIPVVYRLATKVFNRAVALITVCVFTVNALLLEYAVVGLPLTLLIFLSTWLMLTMYNISAYIRDREGQPNAKLPRGQLITAGVLLAMLYLTDTLFIWFAPVASAWLFFQFGFLGKRRWKAVFTFAGWFTVLSLPLWIRYARMGVNPFFGLRTYEVWMNTKLYPDYSAYRLMPGELISGVGLFKAVIWKIGLGLGRIIQGFPQISASWILAFFLPSFLFRFTDPAANRLRQIMMLMFLSLMVGMLLFGIQMPLFVTTIPTMLAFAVAYLLYLIRQAQMRWSSLSMTAVLLGIAVIFPLPYAMYLAPKPRNVKHEAKAAEGLKSYAPKTEAVFSDMPQVVAWYGNRTSIYLPQNDMKIEALRKRFDKARWLFLTENVTTFGEEWRPIYMGLTRYNDDYMDAKNRNVAPPAPRAIMDAQAHPNPVMRMLEGFIAAPPIKGGKRVGIMASNGPIGSPLPTVLPGIRPPAPSGGPAQSADVRNP